MNIEQYRAMVAADKAQKENPVEEPTPAAAPEITPPAPAPDVKKDEPKPVESIEIDGQQVPLDELKNGYLRQSDYTKKTQEVAKTRQEAADAIALYESVRSNPQIAQELQKHVKTPESLDPVQSRIKDLEAKLYDMGLQSEIKDMQSRYQDFDVKQVLSVAQQKRMTNLDDAYKLWKSSQPKDEVDMNALREQIKAELKAELQPPKDTGSIITSSDTRPVVSDNEPHMSDAERRVAKNLGMDVKEYVKWRDVSGNRK